MKFSWRCYKFILIPSNKIIDITQKGMNAWASHLFLDFRKIVKEINGLKTGIINGK